MGKYVFLVVMFVVLVLGFAHADAAFAGDNYCSDITVQFTGDPGSTNQNVVIVTGECHGQGQYRASLWIDYPGEVYPYDPSFLEGTRFESKSGYDVTPEGADPYEIWMRDTRGTEYYRIQFVVRPDYTVQIVGISTGSGVTVLGL